MDWNDWVKMMLGTVIGAVLAALFIASKQTGGAAFDLDTLTKLASAVVALLTLGLVGLTWVLARETRQTWAQNRTPHVLVTVEQSEIFGFFDLVIENVGPGTAFDVQASLAPHMVVSWDSNFSIDLSSARILAIPLLKPRQSIRTSAGRLENFSVKQSVATCRCKDADGKAHLFSNSIDLSAYENCTRLGENWQTKVPDELERIRKSIDAFSSGGRRLEINTYDRKDRGAEKAAHEKWLEEMRVRRGDGAGTAPEQVS